MTIQELKAMVPGADVYEFREDARYLIVVDRNLVQTQDVMKVIESKQLKCAGGVFMFVDGPTAEAVRILELKGTV